MHERAKQIKKIKRRILNKLDLIFSVAGIDSPATSRNILFCQKAINQVIEAISAVKNDTIAFAIFHFSSTILVRNPGGLPAEKNTRLAIGVMVFAFIEWELIKTSEYDPIRAADLKDALLQDNDEGVTQEFAIATRISKYYAKIFHRHSDNDRPSTSDLVKVYTILREAIPKELEKLLRSYYQFKG